MKNKKKKSYYEVIGNALLLIFMLSFIFFGSDVSTNNIYRFVGIIFCAFEGLHIIKEKKLVISPYLKTLIIFFVFTIVLSYLYFKSHSGIMLSIYIFLYIGVSFMAYNFYNTIDDGREKFLKLLLYNGLIISIYVLIHYGLFNFFSLLASGKRVGQELANVNMIGLNTIISCLIVFYYYIFHGDKKKLFYLIPLLIVSLGTGSKKVLISMILGVLLITISKYKKNITKQSLAKFFFTFVILISIYIILSKIPAFKTIFSRFKNLFESILKSGEFDLENRDRANFIKYGFEVFKSNPIIGVGYGNSSKFLLLKFNYDTYFHNNYIELLATTGIIGTALYYLSYVFSIKHNLIQLKFNENDNLSQLCLIFIIIQLIIEYGMVSNQLPFIYLYMVLWNLKSNTKGMLKND